MHDDSWPRIGVLNLSSHENLLLDLCRIADGTFPISIFTTSDIQGRLDEYVSTDTNYLDWILKQENESMQKFLRRVENYSKNLDILITFPYYGNVFDYIQFSRFDPDCEYYLYTFDVNGWIGENIGFTPKIYNYIKYPLKQSILGKIDVLLVEYEPIRKYTEAHFSEVPVRSFTPVVSTNASDDVTPMSGRFVITIPGMIDQTRRDYDTVISAFEQLEREQLEELELVLLGAPTGQYGRNVIQRAKDLKSHGLAVTSFDDWINPNQFDRQLKLTNLLVSPLVRTRQIDGFVEYYGLSKGSGAISDAIRNSTPLLLPEWYKKPTGYKMGINHFTSVDDLTEKFVKISSSQKQSPDPDTEDIADKYSPENQSEKLKSVILENN